LEFWLVSWDIWVSSWSSSTWRRKSASFPHPTLVHVSVEIDELLVGAALVLGIVGMTEKIGNFCKNKFLARFQGLLYFS
jgi:hypothetical protein